MVAKHAHFLLVPLAVSCGGDDGPKMIRTPDSGMGSGGSGSANVDTCKVNASYNPTFNMTGMGHRATDVPPMFDGSNNGHIIYSYGLLEPIPDGSNLGDYLEIDLFAGYGGFGSGDIVPGTYVIQGDELDWSLCGICVALQGDYNIDTDEIDDWLLAKTGMVVITQASGSAYKVSLQNATFQRVIADADGNPTTDPQTDVACESAIGSAVFDLPLTPAGSGSGSGSAVGKPTTGRHALRRALRHRFY